MEACYGINYETIVIINMELWKRYGQLNCSYGIGYVFCINSREFPGGPVVRAQRFRCSGPRFNT